MNNSISNIISNSICNCNLNKYLFSNKSFINIYNDKISANILCPTTSYLYNAFELSNKLNLIINDIYNKTGVKYNVFDITIDTFVKNEYTFKLDVSLLDNEDIRKLMNLCDLTQCRFYSKYNYYDDYSYEEMKLILDFSKQESNKLNNDQLDINDKCLNAFNYVNTIDYKDDEDYRNFRKSRSLHEVINNNYAVCAGYSKLYMSLLNDLNIECGETIYINALGKKHSTNIVKINNELYEIDVTWAKKDLNTYFMIPLNEAIDLKEHMGLSIKEVNYIDNLNKNKLLKLVV